MRSLLAALVVLAALAVTAAPAAAQPACGDVLTEDTTLESDLQCDERALIIGADGITLDLGGHAVSGHGAAVFNDGFDNVTIRNGAVESSTEPVSLRGVSGNTVENLFVEGIVQGIALRDSDDNRILGNELLSAVLSLSEGSERNVVRDNLLRGREGVMRLHRATDNRIVENVVRTGGDTAMSMAESHRNVLRDNALVVHSYGYSLAMTGSDDNRVVRNQLVHEGNNSDPGVTIQTSSRNLFRANTIAGMAAGALMVSGADNLFADNDLDGEAPASFHFEEDGLRVFAEATGTVLRRNTITSFADDGIDVEAPGTLIKRNTANDNGDLGIEAVPGVVDGGGNTASGNGNPLQCVNIACG